MLRDRTLRTVTLGHEHRADGLAEFDRVRDARFLPGDGDIAVLDRSPPYLRIFDSAGGFERALLEKGHGPGEVSNPTTMAVAADGRIAVLHGSSISVIRGDGTFIRRYTNFPALLRGVIPACDGGWLVYVRQPPSPADAEVATASLYHVRSERGGGARSSGLLLDRAIREYMPGHPPFVNQVSGRTVLFHEKADPPYLAEWACDEASARHLDYGIKPGSPPRMIPTGPAPGGGYYARLDPGEPPYPAGVVLLREGLIWAERLGKRNARASDREDEQLLTRLWLLGRGSPQFQDLPGWFWLHDYVAGTGFLLSGVDSIPEVFVLPEGAVLRGFRPRAE